MKGKNSEREGNSSPAITIEGSQEEELTTEIMMYGLWQSEQEMPRS